MTKEDTSAITDEDRQKLRDMAENGAYKYAWNPQKEGRNEEEPA